MSAILLFCFLVILALLLLSVSFGLRFYETRNRNKLVSMLRTVSEHGGERFVSEQHHEISLLCDDIEQTVADLTAKGARFQGGIEDRGFGLTVMLEIPGAGEMMLYEPKHPLAHNL